MKIQILGTGCANCQNLEKTVRQAVEALALDCEIEKVTDMATIVSMGVMATPALAVDGAIKSSGRLLSLEELKKLLS